MIKTCLTWSNAAFTGGKAIFCTLNGVTYAAFTATPPGCIEVKVAVQNSDAGNTGTGSSTGVSGAAGVPQPIAVPSGGAGGAGGCGAGGSGAGGSGARGSGGAGNPTNTISGAGVNPGNAGTATMAGTSPAATGSGNTTSHCSVGNQPIVCLLTLLLALSTFPV